MPTGRTSGSRGIDLAEDSFHGCGVLPRIVALFGFFLVLSPSAEGEEDLVWGIETVTGLRSDLVYRGFDLADATLETQVETEVTLGANYALGLAAWHSAESSDNFAETGLGVNLRRDFEKVSLTLSLDYHDFSESLFQDGADLGLKAQWFLTENWDLAIKGHYDFGAEGSYFAMEGGWSHPLSEKLFLAAESGVSALENYYARSGMNDFYGRLSVTYNVNSFLSLTPFLGYSVGLAEGTEDTAFLGLWLAVTF